MTNVNSDKAAESTSTPSKQAGAHRSSSSGLPLRGFAMVLIAVAVMLGMWGLYTLTSKDSTDTAQTGSTGVATLPAPAEGEPGAQGGPSAQPGAADSTARGTQDAKAGQDAAGQPAKEGQDVAGREAANKDGAAAGAAGAVGAESAAGAERAAKDIPVNVFNNSGRANFAAEQADKLKEKGFKIGEVGNLAGDILTVPQTTVYFPAGDKDAESLARETAAQFYGAQSIPEGAIAEYPAELKAEFTKGNAVVAVLAIPQA